MTEKMHSVECQSITCFCSASLWGRHQISMHLFFPCHNWYRVRWRSDWKCKRISDNTAFETADRCYSCKVSYYCHSSASGQDTETSLNDMIELLKRKPEEQAKHISDVYNKFIMFPLFSVLLNVAPVKKGRSTLVRGIWQAVDKYTDYRYIVSC